jgi:hypothetical protein
MINSSPLVNEILSVIESNDDVGFNRLYIYVHHWDMLNKDQRQCITNLVEVTVVLKSTRVIVKYGTGTLLIQTPALVVENAGKVNKHKSIEV